MDSHRNEPCCAIVAAAGSSQRMSGIDKIFQLIKGKPLISYTIRVFEASPRISNIILVLHESRLSDGEALRRKLGWTKVTSICRGGKRRQDSVLEGLKKAQGNNWVLIHDGARPCIDEDIIERGIEAALETGASVAGVRVKDTIKTAADDLTITATLDRDKLWAIQTPQVFRYDIIHRAYQENAMDVTDDATLVEKLGYKVKVFQGTEENIKVTTPEDLYFVERYLKKRGIV